MSRLMGEVFWIANLIYAFMYWGFWWGLLNLFLPFVIVWDLVKFLGRIE